MKLRQYLKERAQDLGNSIDMYNKQAEHAPTAMMKEYWRSQAQDELIKLTELERLKLQVNVELLKSIGDH